MQEDMQKIIEAGSKAPSGENAQPWKFKVINNSIYQYLVPERDQSVYNYNQYASYVANGAALENIEITARALGLQPKTHILPDSKDSNLVAIIAFEKSQPKNEPLYEYIEKRVTNRKPYKKEPLSIDQKRALLNEKIGSAEFFLVDNSEHINILASVGATNEYLMLQNKAIHNFFFSHINWTEKEENERRYGFYIKTLELPPPAQFMFKVFSKWSRMRIFKALGFPKVVATQNAKINAAASAMGIITIKERRPIDYIKCWRASPEALAFRLKTRSLHSTSCGFAIFKS